MRRIRGYLAVGVALGVLGAGWSFVSAQAPAAKPPAQQAPKAAEPERTVEEILQRRGTLPFAEPTTLADVAAYLQKTLHAPVVLDKAALRRQELTPQGHRAAQARRRAAQDRRSSSCWTRWA